MPGLGKRQEQLKSLVGTRLTDLFFCEHLESKTTRVIDLGGRTVIPGLIDSHLHAIRAASFFATETNWAGVPTLAEALERTRRSAAGKEPGEWVIVGGGWRPEQFKEKRLPTQAELTDAAGDHPAYVQMLYAWALLNQRGLDALGITSDADLQGGARLDRNASGTLTGGITGGIVQLFDRLPRPTLDQQVDGTKKFFRERVQPGPRVRGIPEVSGTHAHGVRRRHDALQRDRGADHLGDQ